jgi:hypothetical protein
MKPLFIVNEVVRRSVRVACVAPSSIYASFPQLMPDSTAALPTT